MYRKYFKRLMDFTLSLCAIIILLPVLAMVTILVRAKLGNPVIFEQKRPGLKEKLFTLYKFRTMTDKRDESGELLPDEMRLTGFGKILRSTSLDEVPELFNILKGDMSLIGPRPLLVRDMVFMTDNQRIRHSVRQGLTGLAQVSGRNGISWDEKLKLDVYYTENITFLRDCHIILQTFKCVFLKEGITMEGMDTAMDLGDWLLKETIITTEEYRKKQEEALQLLENL